jgi:hypothetical protein
MLWSKSTGGFYNEAVHSNIPEDAINLTEAEYRVLTAKTDQPMVIKPDTAGRPALFPAVVQPPTVEQVERRRLIAYSDPLTGSDRYFAESIRCEAAGKGSAADVAKRAGQARYEEIQKQNPWPEEI